MIAFDDEIDAHYIAIERNVEIVLARQTPVAGDLRLVLALLHCGLHLERVGDQCVTIAKLTKISSHLGIQAGGHREPRATWASAAPRW